MYRVHPLVPGDPRKAARRWHFSSRDRLAVTRARRPGSPDASLESSGFTRRRRPFVLAHGDGTRAGRSDSFLSQESTVTLRSRKAPWHFYLNSLELLQHVFLSLFFLFLFLLKAATTPLIGEDGVGGRELGGRGREGGRESEEKTGQMACYVSQSAQQMFTSAEGGKM